MRPPMKLKTTYKHLLNVSFSLLSLPFKSENSKVLCINMKLKVYPLLYSLRDEVMEGIQPNGVIITF